MTRKPTLGGRVLSAQELAEIRKQIESFGSIEVISDEMRELIASEWPELLAKLPQLEPATIEGEQAVQITDATFDSPRPNDQQIVGVIYDPSERCARVPTRAGEVRAEIGDWIVRGANGELHVFKRGFWSPRGPEFRSG
jgi:hypothetical protein